MNKNRMATVVGVVVAGLVVVGCGRGFSPTAPTNAAAVGAAGFELRGSVSEPGASTGLEGVTATISDGGLAISTTTDENGEFVFTGLSGGMWHISLAKEGFTDQTIDVNVDGNTSIVCQLVAAAKLRAPGQPARVR